MQSTSELSYRIMIAGHLGPYAKDWFEELSISTVGENTLLKGTLKDQASLHGVLNRIRDLNLTLISLDRIMDNSTPTTQLKEAGHEE